MQLDAATTGLDIGNGLAGKLANGDGHFTGGLARGPEGTTFRDLKIRTKQVSATLTGSVGPSTADVTLDARLANVAVIYPGMSGPVTAKGTIKRQGDQLNVNLTGSGPGNIALTGKGTIAADFKTGDAEHQRRRA